jgi:hypothetical protein
MWDRGQETMHAEARATPPRPAVPLPGRDTTRHSTPAHARWTLLVAPQIVAALHTACLRTVSSAWGMGGHVLRLRHAASVAEIPRAIWRSIPVAMLAGRWRLLETPQRRTVAGSRPIGAGPGSLRFQASRGFPLVSSAGPTRDLDSGVTWNVQAKRRHACSHTDTAWRHCML